MKLLPPHPLRAILRLLWFAGELLLALLDYAINVVFKRNTPLDRARPQWLQQLCRRLLRVLNAEIKTQGPIPLHGLLVCNHISYLDIVVLSSITPAVFVAKSEIKRWPVFGWFARLGGTLFVRRNRRSDVAQLNLEVSRVLDAGGLVLLFPEGTSSDGSNVLPFKSSLLEPARRSNHPITAAFIGYSVAEGSVSEDISYWGKMTLFPHLMNLLSKPRISAQVSFTRLETEPASRKELAQHLHSHVLRLKESATEQVIA